MNKVISLIILGLVSITAHAKTTYKVDPKGEVVGILLNKEAHNAKDGGFICLQQTVFMSLRKGLVYCGHQSGESVFRLTNGAPAIPSEMYFTLEELNK